MELYQLNSILIILGVILIILMLLGKTAPKFVSSLIAIFALFYFVPNQFLKSNEQILNEPESQITKDTSETIKQLPIPKKEESSQKRSPSNHPKKQPNTIPNKSVKKYLAKVKFSGITDDKFIKEFENISGYTNFKNADYLIEFSYTGSIKSSTTNEGNRFVFSGGNLIVYVNEDRCCCSGIAAIPADIPLGKTMKEANLIMSKKMVEYARLYSGEIIPMIAECLPKY